MTVTKEEVDRLTQWTRDYLEKAVPQGRFQAIVGLSGGIDSAVIAALCVQAVGADKVHGVIMPCDSDPVDGMLAERLASNFGIGCTIVDLEETFHRWWADYRSTFYTDTRLNRMIPANAKARLRMLTLYAEAARFGGLVIGTTNKTEAILGYATKYGDSGVDIEPLMSFYKKEIYELANLLNEPRGHIPGRGTMIPQPIINRKPTAGLWEGQTDEGELEMSYDRIDAVLMEHGIEKLCIQVVSGEAKAPDVIKIVKLYRANLHKDFHLPHYPRG